MMTAAAPTLERDTSAVMLVDDLPEFEQPERPARSVAGLVSELLDNLAACSRQDTELRLRQILEIVREPSEPESGTTIHSMTQTAFLRRAEYALASRDRTARLLAADDDQHSRDMLALTLNSFGFDVTPAADGREAWDILQRESFDLVLLDIEMPRMSGFDVLRAMRLSERCRHVPVIVISGMDEMESVVTCIEMGAEDHLAKPFNHGLLKARIDASLEKKRLRDAEQGHLEQIRREQEINEALLLNVLPRQIAARLKTGESPIADHFDAATVLFADLVGFTEMSSEMCPSDLVDVLNMIFTEFDHLADNHGLEKIKTIGDSYMVAGGLPEPCDDHAQRVAEFALDIQTLVAGMMETAAPGLSIRVGINTGPVVAGVIGQNKFIYDLWGDTVNVASRMESHGEPGAIQVSESTERLLRNQFELESRGAIAVKGKGDMRTFLLRGMR